MTNMNQSQVAHIANLAHIPIASEDEIRFAKDFETTLKVVDQLMEIDTKAILPTHQVTGLENVWREDVCVPEHSFSQKEALANANHTFKGYFVVPAIFE